MKFQWCVYKLLPMGWQRVQVCKGRTHAMKTALKLQDETGVEHCAHGDYVEGNK